MQSPTNRTTRLAPRDRVLLAIRAAALLTAAGWVTIAGSAHAAPPSYVACIGDRITQGYAASSPSLDWVSDLGTLLGPTATVTNDGVSSTTMMKQSNFSYWTNGDLPMVESFVTAAGPSADVAVIIMLGTNDSKDNPSGVYNWDATAPTRYAADYNAMIDELQALTPRPEVFLALPPPAFPNADSIDDAVLEYQIAPIILGIAQSRQLPVIDVRSALAGMSSLFVDGVHPDDMGHMIIAQTMYAGLLSPAIPAPDGGAPDGSSDAATSGDGAIVDDAGGPSDAMASSDGRAGSDDGGGSLDASITLDGASSGANDGGASEGGGSGPGASGAAPTHGGCAAAGPPALLAPSGWSAAASLLGAICVRRRRRPKRRRRVEAARG